MRGLKPVRSNSLIAFGGRIFYRCVDWNIKKVTRFYPITGVASFTDAWIETYVGSLGSQAGLVASFTDAWIETCQAKGNAGRLESHLLQMRGLKHPKHFWHQLFLRRIFYRCVDWNYNLHRRAPLQTVASFTDAWIETNISSVHCAIGFGRIFYRCVDWNEVWRLFVHLCSVASFTDAWIETPEHRFKVVSDKSHLLQMRGLKRLGGIGRFRLFSRIFYRCVDWNIFIGLGYARPLVASFTDAWIETRCCLCEDSCRESHLLQMRGLKLTFAVENSIWKVASFTDAWIETVRMRLYITLIFGRIFYRCVDWNCDEESIVMGIMCRIFYRCVDWNKAS